MDILVNVINQKLKIATNLKSIVAGSQQFVKFTFSFGADWDGLITFVQFSQNGNSYNQYLDDDNSAYLPSEIVAGTCTLVLYGSRDKIIATTNYLTLTINENILVSDANSTEISESLYNQIISRTAKKNHASTDTTYGAGNGSNYGHVKLSDATNSTSGVNGGVAATPAAVKAVYDKVATLKTEPFTFTYEDGSTRIVEVYVK